MFVKLISAFLLTAPLFSIAQQAAPQPGPRPSHAWAQVCEDWDEWDKPAPPFLVYGNTYYVGTCGIASILITSDDGHVLIDSGTEAGADQVLSNIRLLGFDPEDVALLLNSHEHFDHVGGMAKLQDATGAIVISSQIGVDVMVSGDANSADPQFNLLDPMRPISSGIPYFSAEAARQLDAFGMTPISTPGHSPGAMSWTWQTCVGADCRQAVYADSLSAISSDDYRFSDHPQYVAAFQASLDAIAELDCNILLTPHPSASDMRNRLMAAELSGDFGSPCGEYVTRQRAKLTERLRKEDLDAASDLQGSLSR